MKNKILFISAVVFMTFISASAFSQSSVPANIVSTGKLPTAKQPIHAQKTVSAPKGTNTNQSSAVAQSSPHSIPTAKKPIHIQKSVSAGKGTNINQSQAVAQSARPIPTSKKPIHVISVKKSTASTNSTLPKQ